MTDSNDRINMEFLKFTVASVFSIVLLKYVMCLTYTIINIDFNDVRALREDPLSRTNIHYFDIILEIGWLVEGIKYQGASSHYILIIKRTNTMVLCYI